MKKKSFSRRLRRFIWRNKIILFCLTLTIWLSFFFFFTYKWDNFNPRYEKIPNFVRRPTSKKPKGNEVKTKLQRIEDFVKVRDQMKMEQKKVIEEPVQLVSTPQLSTILCQKEISCFIRNLYYIENKFHIYSPDEEPRELLIGDSNPISLQIHSEPPPTIQTMCSEKKRNTVIFSLKKDLSVPARLGTLILGPFYTLANFELEREAPLLYSLENLELSSLEETLLSSVDSTVTSSPPKGPCLWESAVIGISANFASNLERATETTQLISSSFQKKYPRKPRISSIPLISSIVSSSFSPSNLLSFYDTIENVYSGSISKHPNFQELSTKEKLDLIHNTDVLIMENNDEIFPFLLTAIPNNVILYVIDRDQKGADPQVRGFGKLIINLMGLSLFRVRYLNQYHNELNVKDVEMLTKISQFKYENKFLFFVPRPGVSNWLLSFMSACSLAKVSERTLVIPPILSQDGRGEASLETAFDIDYEKLDCNYIFYQSIESVWRKIDLGEAIIIPSFEDDHDYQSDLPKIARNYFPGSKMILTMAMDEINRAYIKHKFKDFNTNQMVILSNPISSYNFGLEEFKFQYPLAKFIPRMVSEEYKSRLSLVSFCSRVIRIATKIIQELQREFITLRLVRGELPTQFCKQKTLSAPATFQKCFPSLSGATKFIEANISPSKSIYVSSNLMAIKFPVQNQAYRFVSFSSFAHLFPLYKLSQIEIEAIDLYITLHAETHIGSYMEPFSQIAFEKRDIQGLPYLKF